MSGLVHTRKSAVFAAEVVYDKSSQRSAIKFNSPNYVQHFLNRQCQVGDKISVTITNQRPKRTIAQNNYYWGVYLPEIMRATGETEIELLHSLFKEKFLTKKIYPIMGHIVKEIGSTTDLSVNDFINYIMAIEEFTGVAAPPTENFGLAPLRKPV